MMIDPDSGFDPGAAPHGSRSGLGSHEQRESAAAPATAGNSSEHQPENNYCSDCAWPIECARAQACHRRDAGEIRSVYIEDPRSDADASSDGSRSRLSPHKQREGAAAPAPAGNSSEHLTLSAAFRINNYALAQAGRSEAPRGATPLGVSSLTSPGAPVTARPVLFGFDPGPAAHGSRSRLSHHEHSEGAAAPATAGISSEQAGGPTS